MRIKKTKVFLAAFANQTNAQNLSCRALAKYLDKERFEVFTLELKKGNLDGLIIDGVNVFTCKTPVKITGALGFIWGFVKADVVYAPNARFVFWQQLLRKLTGKRLIKSMRMLINEHALKTMWGKEVQSARELRPIFSFADELYAITPYMRDEHRRVLGLPLMERVITPLSDLSLFKQKQRIRKHIKTILFLGKDWERKGMKDFIDLANRFGDLNFIVIGRGNPSAYQTFIKKDNVSFLGQLKSHELAERISEVDLQFLPSRAEGLPRGYIEALANGLPTIVYKDYGMSNYVNHFQDGFLVSDLNEASNVLKELLKTPETLVKISETCIEKAEEFEPAILIKQYEEIFLQQDL